MMTNPLPCGCAILGKPSMFAQGEFMAHTDLKIRFCPMHKAAPDMLAALDLAETRLLIFKEIQPPLWDDDDECALKKAEQALATVKKDK